MFPAAVTLRGIEYFYNEHDGMSVFDDIDLPDGVDPEILVPVIITRCGDFPLLIIEPDYIRNMTALWFASHKVAFERMFMALNEEYNPLHNYDRMESEDHSNAGTRAGETESQDRVTSASSGSDSGSGTTTEKISADDDQNSFVNRSQTENTTSGRTNSTNATNSNRSGSDSEKTTDSGVRHLHAYGNIGITTNMDMLIQEIQGRLKYGSIYEIIAQAYCLEFCVPIY